MKETDAARIVLLEVLNALGAMRDELVVVGVLENKIGIRAGSAVARCISQEKDSG